MTCSSSGMRMDNKTALLVINPISGVSQPDIIRSRFERLFHEAGWQTRIYQTTGDENLEEVVRQLSTGEITMVVASGGDGTISEVGSGLAYTGIPLGHFAHRYLECAFPQPGDPYLF